MPENSLEDSEIELEYLYFLEFFSKISKLWGNRELEYKYFTAKRQRFH